MLYGEYEESGKPHTAYHDTTLNGQPIYRKDKAAPGAPSPIFMFYHSNKWWVSDQLPSGNRIRSWLSGAGSTPLEVRSWSEQGVRCVADVPRPPPIDGRLFVDREFPPDDCSVGEDAIGEVECWLRSDQLAAPEDRGRLFDDIAPDDLLQGAIGNCWLLAALAAVAEFPELIESLFREDGSSPTGEYTVRLWSAEADDWQCVHIDNLIPSKWNFGEPEACFANSPPGGEEWPLLIEKAVAKFCGSFDLINGGSNAWGLMTLLGPEDKQVVVFNRVDHRGKEWGRWFLSADKLRESGVTRRPGDVVLHGKRNDKFTIDMLWRCLMNDDINNKVALCGGVEKMAGSVASASGQESIRPDQLVTGHAYSLLRVHEQDGFRLVQLRNPWGNEIEYKGPWGDKSPEWRQHPHIARAVKFNPEKDGTFWMAFEMWADLFSSVTICDTKGAFEKARSGDEGGFAASRAGRGKQYGRISRKPHGRKKKDRGYKSAAPGSTSSPGPLMPPPHLSSPGQSGGNALSRAPGYSAAMLGFYQQGSPLSSGGNPFESRLFRDQFR